MSLENAHRAEVAAQHAVIGVAGAAPSGFVRNPHPDAQWFPEAGLGLLICWGLSSVQGQGDLSWSMMSWGPDRARWAAQHYGLPAVQAPVTPAHYWAQAKNFQPDRYHPRKWAAAAREAGMTYAVFTTRHHDGFALWPSDHGELNTKNFLGGRDLVGEFVTACRAEGLKVGLYYSPPDWYWHRDHMTFRYDKTQPPLGIHHEPITLPVLSPDEEAARMASFRKYLRGQIEELLTRYGQIDLLWFDGKGEDSISIERLRELQPGIVINPRAHGHGDFHNAECGFPKERFPGWWEYCHVFSDGAWSYLDHEIYKPLGWFLAEFIRARSWGGSFLPSVGPDAHGELPRTFFQRMAQLQKWLAHSGVAVFGVEPGPWPEKSNVPLTRRGETLYAHADWIHDGPLLIDRDAEVRSVRLLRTGQPLSWKTEEGKLRIEIPSDLRTTLLDTVEIL